MATKKPQAAAEEPDIVMISEGEMSAQNDVAAELEQAQRTIAELRAKYEPPPPTREEYPKWVSGNLARNAEHEAAILRGEG